MKKLWETREGSYFKAAYPPVMQVIPLPPDLKRERQEKEAKRLIDQYGEWLNSRAGFWLERYNIRYLDKEDLIPDSLEALIEAKERYDPEKGVPLTAFAVKAVDKRIKEYLGFCIWFRENCKSIYEDSEEEMGEKGCLTASEKEKLLIGEDSDQYRNHNIYTETPEEFYFRNEERQRITDAIRELDITSQRYIARRFFESDKKQRRFTAKYFGIAPALAKEIEKDALEELKKTLFSEMNQ